MPKGFTLDEVESIYVGPRDRYVVALIVGYDEDDLQATYDTHSGRLAARAALDLTTDGGCEDTTWFVYDRMTGLMHSYEQAEFDPAFVSLRTLVPAGDEEGN